MEKGQDAWEKRYKLAGIKTNNAKGSFYTCQVKPGGLPDDAQKARAEELYRQFANTVIETEVDDMAQNETAVSNDF
jgi:hypothetical protein